MGKDTGISWTQASMNFWKGCAKVSPGCKNCYMFREMERYGLNPEEITRTKTWRNPRKWNKEAEAEKKPSLVFTCSWSDFFIEESDPWREEAWKIIKDTPWLQWQILTKRIKRVNDCLPADWGTGYPNVWMGVSIESATYNWRAEELRKVPARIRFISAEPLLASCAGLDLTDIHWLIAGAESGSDHRPMELDWARELRDMCIQSNVPFFYKQGPDVLPGKHTFLDGREWNEYPTILLPATSE